MSKKSDIEDRIYEAGVQHGIKTERARIWDNYHALMKSLSNMHGLDQSPIDILGQETIDLAIRQVITGDELGRPPETGPSEHE